MKKAIFWDSDGTLLYNNESFKCSMIKAIGKAGYTADADAVGAFMRANCSWYRPEVGHSDKNGEEWWAALLESAAVFLAGQGVSADAIGSTCAAFRQGVIDYGYRCYDDAAEVLAYFRGEGYENYVISNNFPELGEVFGRLGLSRYVSGYILSADVGYEKPREEIFRRARELAGEPDECYMIGDNPAADYLGGLRAGMKPVLVHAAPKNGETACASLTELKNIIR